MTAPLSRAVYKRWITVTLRRLRENAHVTQQAAAEELNCSPKRIAHFESGRNFPHTSDLETLLPLYGAGDQTADLIELVRQVRDAPAEADLSRLASVPSGFDTFLGLEQGCSELVEWAVLTVPGLLQTRDYATAVMRGHETGLREPELNRRVDLRMRRQSVLHRVDDPPRVEAIVDDSVLWRQVGGPHTLRDQLRYLVELSSLSNVSIQVLPSTVVVPAALHGPFTAMHFPIPGDAGLIYLEDRTGGRAHEDPDAIDDYLSVLKELRHSALDEDTSRQRITEIGETLT